MREWPPVRQRRRAGAASAHLTARPPLTPRGENCACVQGIGFIQLASPTTEGLGWHSPLPPSSRKRSRSSPEIWAQVSAAGRYLQQEGAGGEEVAFPNPYFAYLRPAAIPVFPQTPELNFLRDASCVTVTIGHLSATPRLPSRWHHTLARAVCVYVWCAHASGDEVYTCSCDCTRGQASGYIIVARKVLRRGWITSDKTLIKCRCIDFASAFRCGASSAA